MTTLLTIAIGVTLAIMMVSCSSASGSELPDNRKLGSILNNDINNILWALSGSETTPAEYKKAVLYLLDTKPGVLAQNVGMPDPVIYRSNVATTFDKYHHQVLTRMWPNEAKTVTEAACMKALLDAGTDPLTLTIEACRERGIPIVASYRMNAADFGDGELDLYDFGRAHKNLRIPGHNCLDPVHPEVFQHRMDIFTEVANKYDIDGIEFDFRRTSTMISNPEKNHVVLTRMVRQTRKMLDEVARKKGRKRLLLGVRVAPMLIDGAFTVRRSTDHSCKYFGLDVTAWIKKGLVDYVCPSFHWGYNPQDNPQTAEFAALAKGTNVGIYPTVFPYSIWQSKGPEAERIDLDEPDLKRYRNDILDAALKCYAEGADGISTFNWVPHQQPGMTKRNIRESWGLGAARIQMYIHPMLRDRKALAAYRGSNIVLPPELLTVEPQPSLPIKIVNPKHLTGDEITAQRIPLGIPNDYKPWIVQLKNGQLLVVAFCFDGKPYSERAVFWRSNDGGLTWSDRQERRDLPGREFSPTCLSDGTLIMPCYLLENDVNNKDGYMYSMVYRSTNNGKTWSATRIGPEGFPARVKTCPNRNAIEMPDPNDPGKTLVMLGVSMMGGKANPLHVYLWRSWDSGLTWDKTLKPDTQNHVDVDGFFSQSFTYRAISGKLLHVIRVDGHGRHWQIPELGQSDKPSTDHADRMMLWESSDNGFSWTKHGKHGTFGTYGEMYPRFLKLKDGRLLLTFTVRSKTSMSTDDYGLGLRAVISYDNGETWDFEHDRLVLSYTNEGSSGGGFGNTIQLDDGTLVSCYSYRGGDGKTHVEAIRWSLPE